MLSRLGISQKAQVQPTSLLCFTSPSQSITFASCGPLQKCSLAGRVSSSLETTRSQEPDESGRSCHSNDKSRWILQSGLGLFEPHLRPGDCQSEILRRLTKHSSHGNEPLFPWIAVPSMTYMRGPSILLMRKSLAASFGSDSTKAANDRSTPGRLRGATNLRRVHEEPSPVCGQPLLRTLHVGAEALHEQPKTASSGPARPGEPPRASPDTAARKAGP